MDVIRGKEWRALLTISVCMADRLQSPHISIYNLEGMGIRSKLIVGFFSSLLWTILLPTLVLHSAVANANWLHLHNCAKMDASAKISSSVRGDDFIGNNGEIVPVSLADGRIALFARGKDSFLWQKWLIDGEQWSDWEVLAGFTRFTETPSFLYNEQSNILEVI